MVKGVYFVGFVVFAVLAHYLERRASHNYGACGVLLERGLPGVANLAHFKARALRDWSLLSAVMMGAFGFGMLS